MGRMSDSIKSTVVVTCTSTPQIISKIGSQFSPSLLAFIPAFSLCFAFWPERGISSGTFQTLWSLVLWGVRRRTHVPPLREKRWLHHCLGYFEAGFLCSCCLESARQVWMWSVCSEASWGWKEETPSTHWRDKQNHLRGFLVGLCLFFPTVCKFTNDLTSKYASSCIYPVNFAELTFMISVLQSVKSEWCWGKYFPACWHFLAGLKHCRELHPYAVQFLNFHCAGSRKKSKGDLVWSSSKENKMFSSKYSVVQTKTVVKCSVSFKMFSLGFQQWGLFFQY